MKKYLFEIIFCFLLPLALIAGVAEYSIRKIPNDYAYKNHWMQEHSSEIQTLCLGPSTIFYGINPAFLSKKGFNAAYLLQSMNYDCFIFNKYLDQMDALQYVIIGIDSPAWNLEKGPEWWRAISYSIYYGCNYHEHEIKYNYELSPHNFTTLEKSWDGILNLLHLKKTSYLTVNEQGFGTNYSFKKRATNWDNGAERADLLNEVIKPMFQSHEIDKNADFLREICQKCLERDVKVLLLNTPVYQTYRNHINPQIITERDYFCESFAETFPNVYYINYADDARFTANDFYDGNHLNEYGAQKFTSIIDSVINRLADDQYFSAVNHPHIPK